MDSLEVPRKLWEHPNPKDTEMYKFMQLINQKYSLELKVGTFLLDEDKWPNYINRPFGICINSQ